MPHGPSDGYEQQENDKSIAFLHAISAQTVQYYLCACVPQKEKDNVVSVAQRAKSTYIMGVVSNLSYCRLGAGHPTIYTLYDTKLILSQTLQTGEKNRKQTSLYVCYCFEINFIHVSANHPSDVWLVF